LRRTPFYGAYKALGHHPDYWYWHLRGRPVRAPHLLKQRTVREYGTRLSLGTLVEAGTYYGDRLFGALATQLRTSSWVPALLALGFASGFIHYLLDRSVFRMSEPGVRIAAAGLLNQRNKI